MREIKFRVWDKETKYMHILGENQHDTLQFDSNNNVSYYNLQNGCGSLTDEDDYILMQFTGLYDKNGKDELYESDYIVCRKYIGGNWVDYSIERGYIGFKNGAFYLVRKEGFYRPLDWLVDMDYEIEKLGNIYENPSLLAGDNS